MRRLDRDDQILTRPIFGGDGALLVELTQIEQVVAGVADVIAAGSAFACGWNPNRRDAGARKLSSTAREIAPQHPATRVVPVEELHQDTVLHEGGLYRLAFAEDKKSLCLRDHPQSLRNATIGSARVARRAGM